MGPVFIMGPIYLKGVIMAAKNFIQPIAAVHEDVAALTTVFQLLATVPESVSILRLVNNSNSALVFGYNALVTHEMLRPDSDVTLYFQTVRQPGSETSLLRTNTDIYVALETEVEDPEGTVYVIGYYQE